MPGLFIGHTNGTIVYRVSISVSGIKKIEIFFCKIQPSSGIKIPCMILSHRSLKTSLPDCDHLVKRFSRRGKIIRISGILFMKITMYGRHPLIVFFNPALCFYLCLPCPIPVQIKMIMIASSSGPWLIVFCCITICIRMIS